MTSPSPVSEFDVVVVGSGAAGVTAALRARHLGLSVLIVEKGHQFGGTTATSGGLMWIPNNGLVDNGDTRAKALAYLAEVGDPEARPDRLGAYVDTGPEVIRFFRECGIQMFADKDYPDYVSDAKNAGVGRSVGFVRYDGALLGDDFQLLRDQFDRFKLFGRVAFDLQEMYLLGVRKPGWLPTLLKGLLRYWFDLGYRRKSRRDRKLTMGNAMMAQLWKALRTVGGVELWLSTALEDLVTDGGRVVGAKVSRFGQPIEVRARHGVLLAAGGFEQNRDLRDRYWKARTDPTWSLAPKDQNTGEAFLAALRLGAATEFLDEGWWVSTMRMPTGVANLEETHITVFDIARPHGFCVNRAGKRFANESGPYDRFGRAQIEDHERNGGGTIPCWLVFDAQFRRKFTAGGFDPSPMLPDRKIPPHWWDHYLFRADTLGALAAKIGVDGEGLARTAADFNRYAASGVDEAFGRGTPTYDRMWGDPKVTPNPCLGTVIEPPFYALPINLGDIGTKGGLKADQHARVLDAQDRPIPGLYAAGNASGSVFGRFYPGAGGTIGPAVVYGYRAAEHIAGCARAR